MYVGEDRVADLPYHDTHCPPVPLPSLFLASTPRGRGELTLGKAMSLSPRMGDLCGRGVLGAPFHDSVPGGR